MPVLENPRHERFAQELAKGVGTLSAYASAGFKPIAQNACRLMKNDAVRARVAELQDRASCRVEITIDTLIAEAEEARLLAMSTNQPAAAISAIKEKGILKGLRVEKREQRHVSIEDMTDADLAAIAIGKAPEVTAH